MPTGAITGYIDVAQVVLYVFWLFFAGLIFYLRREDKREGYPLESDRTARTDRIIVQGFPAIPAPKTFHLADGRTVQAPRQEPPARDIAAEAVAPFPGAPLAPTGDPLADGVGPAAWANRADEPDVTTEGQPKIVPLRVADDFQIAEGDPDPRGLPVLGADDAEAGTVRDVWVDRAEIVIRFLEVELSGAGEGEKAPPRVLLPFNLCRVIRPRNVRDTGRVRVKSLLSGQFAGVPRLRNPDRVTLREEDRIMAYYGGGQMYATPARQEPFL